MLINYYRNIAHNLSFYFPYTVDLRDVKEVRPGRISKDFDKWPDELKKMDPATCFVIFYGKDFRLKTVSVAGELQVIGARERAT